ncbi:N-acetylglucosamine kinase [Paenibacillus sp. GCM10027626]|uniref:N-acetylglucosamine kinase n=1 Tax=Paenibacillus sp. GCM10027626 TaxID=3273411 RepID=UPI003645BB69
MPSNNTYKRYIGIDGGGTKTIGILGDETGQILAVCRGEGTNVKSKSWSEAQQIVKALIEETLQQGQSDLSQLEVVYLGLAGSDRPEDKARWSAFLQAGLPEHVRAVIHNDAINALAAGTWGRGGIVLIAGTGSIAYGFDPATGTSIRVGGWGYLLGDEGSGFDLGRQALTAVMKAYDGRGEETMLTELLLERLGLAAPPQLITHYYEQKQIRPVIAEASRFVMEAAEQGDAVSLSIIDGAVHELGQLAATAAKKLGMRGTVPLVLGGGLFASELFAGRFVRLPAIRAGSFSPERLLLPPAIGSYVLALAEAGHHMTEQMKQRIVEHFKEREELYYGADKH